MFLEPYEFASCVVQVHTADRCMGEFCCLHNPSPHHMRYWPKDIHPNLLVYRLCPHGVAHPDPDSIAHFLPMTAGDIESLKWHSCDGCCTPPPVLSREEIAAVLREAIHV